MTAIMKANSVVTSSVNDKFWLQYTDIWVGDPCRTSEENLSVGSSVTPNECRLVDTSYSAPIFVNYKYWRNDHVIIKRNVKIGRMPVMLRSSKCILTGKSEADMCHYQECSIDPGGYFIIRGQEKVVLVQEQLSKNRILVEAAHGITQAAVTSSTHERKSKSYVIHKKGRLYVRHNVLTEDVPVVIILKAMGIEADNEILRLTAGEDSLYQDSLAASFEEASRLGMFTMQQCLDHIGNRVRVKRTGYGFGRTRHVQQEALEALSNVLVTHVPVKGFNLRPKAIYIAFMTRRVLMALHDQRTYLDDRDFVGNKRLELAGSMLSLLFEDHFKRFNAEFKSTIDRVLSKKSSTLAFDAHQYFTVHSGSITAGIERAIATGNWNLKRFKMERAGVTHVLSRLSYISALGMLTRITSQFEKTRKISGPRALQSSQFGVICPSDTPEGESCGLVKALALASHITTADSEGPVRQLIFALGAEDLSSATGEEIYAKGTFMIFLNGTPIALTRQPSGFLRSFRKLRRQGRLSGFISIFVNQHFSSVQIATDEGRVCRPLIVVENGKSKASSRYLQSLKKGSMGFDDFLARGLVEYLDVNEENDANIAMTAEDIQSNTTHLEIEPFSILGVVAGIIPYPHHNQSPRNTYQCAMGKQAMGTLSLTQLERIDTLKFLMVYPQKPLVTTRAIELIKYDQLPAGQNAIVAIVSYSGYDIEDAIVLNKASCDRGFARAQVFRKVSSFYKKYGNGTADDFGRPNTDIKPHKHIGSDGIVQPGSRLENGDSYLIKNVPINTTATGVGSDIGTPGVRIVDMAYRLQDPCYADRVMLASNEAETTILKVQTRQTRIPEVGDKFSSRHGQKGVVGLIAEQEDLPFTDEGIQPDLLMNPHGFPSRMTVGKMLELVAGKSGVLHGNSEYGTAFGGSKIEDMGRGLVEKGFSYSGKDYMTCGTTGEPLPAYVFFGPVYYQRLKHMVADKMHARASGPRAMLTRQPTEGRSRGGGLRLGEMERDCLIAYGASQLLVERLMLSSDKFDCDLCQTCGMMGYHGWCQTCKSSSNVTTITLPYAAKLLIQELMSMNIKATLKLGPAFANER